MAETVLDLLLAFVGFFYWPLFYMQMRDTFYRYKITNRKLLLSFILALIAGFVAVISKYAIYPSKYFPFMIFLAFISVALLFLMQNLPSKRTKIKVIVLAIYFHIAWQMLPLINLYTLATELSLLAVVIFLARHKFRKHERLQDLTPTEGSINELWEKGR